MDRRSALVMDLDYDMLKKIADLSKYYIELISISIIAVNPKPIDSVKIGKATVDELVAIMRSGDSDATI